MCYKFVFINFIVKINLLKIYLVDFDLKINFVNQDVKLTFMLFDNDNIQDVKFYFKTNS